MKVLGKGYKVKPLNSSATSSRTSWRSSVSNKSDNVEEKSLVPYSSDSDADVAGSSDHLSGRQCKGGPKTHGHHRNRPPKPPSKNKAAVGKSELKSDKSAPLFTGTTVWDSKSDDWDSPCWSDTSSNHISDIQPVSSETSIPIDTDLDTVLKSRELQKESTLKLSFWEDGNSQFKSPPECGRSKNIKTLAGRTEVADFPLVIVSHPTEDMTLDLKFPAKLKELCYQKLRDMLINNFYHSHNYSVLLNSVASKLPGDYTFLFARYSLSLSLSLPLCLSLFLSSSPSPSLPLSLSVSSSPSLTLFPPISLSVSSSPSLSLTISPSQSISLTLFLCLCLSLTLF